VEPGLRRRDKRRLVARTAEAKRIVLRVEGAAHLKPDSEGDFGVSFSWRARTRQRE
jgi:hypothetical protein